MPSEAIEPLLEAITAGHCAVAALLLACVAFVLLCWGALRLERCSIERIAAIPLSDRVEEPRDEC